MHVHSHMTVAFRLNVSIHCTRTDFAQHSHVAHGFPTHAHARQCHFCPGRTVSPSMHMQHPPFMHAVWSHFPSLEAFSATAMVCVLRAASASRLILHMRDLLGERSARVHPSAPACKHAHVHRTITCILFVHRTPVLTRTPCALLSCTAEIFLVDCRHRFRQTVSLHRTAQFVHI